MIVTIIVAFATIACALLMAIYTHRLFNTRSNGMAFTLLIMISAMGTVEVLWFIPTVVRYFLS
jgi:hypothetical protein